MRRMRLSIAQKLIFSLSLLVILSFGALVTAHLMKLYDTNLRESELLARQQSMEYIYRFSKSMDRTAAMIDSLEAALRQMHSDNRGDRELVADMLRQSLREHPELLGVYTLWEPDAFDGNDAANRNKTAYDDGTGRFIPYAVHEDGEIRMYPLTDYEDKELGSYYQVPKRTKRFSLIEPYAYRIVDRSVLMTSLVKPILDGQGRFLGIVGADISLASVQEDIEAVRPLGGYANIITAGNKYLACGGNAELIMQPYRMWSDERALEALKGAEPRHAYTPGDDGEGNVLRMFHPIAIKDSLWHIETVIPKNNMLSDYYKSLKESIVIAVLALVFLTVMMTLLVQRIILVNIQKVVRATSEDLDGGERGRLIIETNDEFESMAKHFNDMMDQRKKAESLIEYQSTHDLLTGLPNRYAYHRLFEAKAMEETAQEDGHMALLFIDLDRFKLINDTLDYALGDQLLQEVAMRIANAVGGKGKVFRFGGDEFIALMGRIPHLHQAQLVSEDVLETIAEPIYLRERIFYMTASIGMSVHRELTPNTGDQLVKEADIAMYVAKKERNTCKLYSPSMNDVPKKELMLENSMFKALEEEQFTLFYQPKIDVATGRIYGAEALIRWRHPDFGMVSPLEFIPLAEKTGFIIPLGEWVLRKACMQISEWERMGLPLLSVSVNMSMIQFQQKQIVHTIERAIAAAGIRPEQIELEITESIFMDNPEHTLKILHELQQLGVKLSLDDFGTGYSSLSYLQNIPLHTLKLDKSFISDIVSDFKKQMIYKSVIVIAHHLNLKVVTEGVETEDEMSIIREHNCDAVQGYIYSPPVPAAKFAQIYTEHRATGS
ncbi:bifunctional diguanylate cyclase/phosphodiesterase [Paenibacillus arenilitoris]|uniref:EAL domain-containing protein n=1 Tax=Paenibacillus arenilitoris TaxID=2772299 RepID=A0A927H6V0_9BACL|nr:EAL domain-containing protein [Paenibacillus arenilitoris]MBD2870946.1 EAL domain-containing protein [Paenibacillus arenilitoris]